MSSKVKNISDLVSDLQSENEKLQSLWKHFNAMCKSEFGLDVKALHQALEKLGTYEHGKAGAGQQLNGSRSEA